jgi:Uma2 family endonuclease
MSTAMESLRPAHRINFDEFCRLYETAVLDSDSRVELIDGVIIDMERPGIDHEWAVGRLSKIFHSMLGDAVAIRTQAALHLDEWNFFVPDIILLRGPDMRYRRRHPTPEDVLLVVEASDSTLRKVLKTKLPVYAANNTAEAWVLDVLSMELHIQRASEEGRPPKTQTLALTRSTRLPLHGLPGVEVDLSSLLDV